jgi:membrane protein
MAIPNKTESGTTRPEDASLAELGQRLSEQTTRLVQQEVELAKAELSEKGKRIGAGAGVFSAAGLLGLFGLGVLTAAVILALATAMSAWVAALIVAAVYLAVAGVLALVAKGKVESATPPLPEQAIASSKQDVEEVKARAREGRA